MTTRDKVFKAYELLATDSIASHMDGLNLLDEARREDMEAVMRAEHEIDQYKFLSITAKDEKTDIYLVDPEGHPVQHEKGFMQTSVAPGKYLIYFGFPSTPRQINLIKDTNVHE